MTSLPQTKFKAYLNADVVPNEESPIWQSDHVTWAPEGPPTAVGRRNPLDIFAVRSVDVDLVGVAARRDHNRLVGQHNDANRPLNPFDLHLEAALQHLA